MNSKRTPRLLSLAWNYQIKFSYLVQLLQEYGIDKENLCATSFVTQEIIETVEQHLKKKKSGNKNNENTIVHKTDISYNEVENISNYQKIKIEAPKLEGPKIISKIDILNNDGKFYSKNNKTKFTRREEGKHLNIEEKENLGLAIGAIYIFDYNKNDFGIIENIVTENKIKIDKARVFGDSLKTNKRLNKGDIVFFQLNYSNNYYHKYIAKDVDILDNISINNFISLLNVFEENNIVKYLLNINHGILDSIGEEKEIIILNKIIAIADPIIWKTILRFKNSEFIKRYVTEIIDQYGDDIKLNYIWESNNEVLFDNIIKNWNSSNVETINNLLNFIQKNNISEIHNSKNLIESINNSELGYKSLIDYTKILKTEAFRSKLISSFSFTHDLKFLSELFSFETNELEIIKKILKSEIASLPFNKIFEIYQGSKDINLISNYDDFIYLLEDTQLDICDLNVFIKSIPKEYISNEVKSILKNSIANIKEWKLDEIVDELNFKTKAGKYVIDLILNIGGSFNSWKLLNLIREKANSKLINKYFLDKYSNELTESNLFETLELAIENNSKKAQEASYKNITSSNRYNIYSEHDLLLILEKLANLEIPDNIQILNYPFSKFVSFLKKTNNFEINLELKYFLTEYSGASQTLVVKYLIYQFYIKNISKNKLIEILNSFNWSEISALIIVELIKEINYTGKILVEKLDHVYKNHFLLLSNNKFHPSNFLNSFQIGNIIGKCNGRKQYEGNNWQNKRWYFKNGNVKYSTNRRDDFGKDFFCEGRPWKVQDVWDANSGKDTGKKIDFYWCKSQYCASRNDSVDIQKPYYSWTISEICHVMGITIEKLALAHMAGWANRLNQIVEHLFCRECKEILRPIPFAPHTLGYYAVPIFNCLNRDCSEHGKRIRFTHCLNGKCTSHKSSEPLDSRDCESCNKNDTSHTGLLCKYCGQPCPKCSGGYKPVYAEVRF